MAGSSPSSSLTKQRPGHVSRRSRTDEQGEIAVSVDTTDMTFRTFNLRRDPKNEVTYENRDRIQIADLEGLCAPGLSH